MLPALRRLSMSIRVCSQKQFHFVLVGILIFKYIYNKKIVHKQTISGHPLFISPITCWLLGNQVTIRWAMILHPCQGFTDSILKKIMLIGHFSKNANTQQKQRRSITRSSILFAVPVKEYDPVLSDFVPVFPILSECSLLASDSQKQQFSE